ncbi:MAG: SMC-Scp complex subunit ScpB [Micrococcales bacterium]|nr:SMC-Scp complex subunit ScpB [Micrococcales bacterium]
MSQARAALEAVLMVIDEPASSTDLAIAVDLPVPRVEQLLEELATEYRGAGSTRPRGFELRQVAGGWRIYSNPDFAEVVARFVTDGATAKLTQAALETLAIVAYKGPISRGQIAAVRGVSVDSVVRTLLTRGLIEEVEVDPVTGASLFATTGDFLQAMGLASLDQLEPLAPHLPAGQELAEIEEQISHEPASAAPRGAAPQR